MKNTLESLGQTGKGIAELIQAKQNIQKTQADIDLVRSQKQNVDMDTTVKSKDVPRADVTNSVYDWAKKVFDNATRSSVSPRQKQIDDYMREFDRRMQEKAKTNVKLRSY